MPLTALGAPDEAASWAKSGYLTPCGIAIAVAVIAVENRGVCAAFTTDVGAPTDCGWGSCEGCTALIGMGIPA